jgi:alkylhydroperoxidase family enzyme
MKSTDPRYASLVRTLADTLLSAPGDTPSELRRAVEARAAGRDSPDLPKVLEPYVEKVGFHAYRVVDADIEALKAAGYSEDAIFEITLSAALGAGLVRLERGLAAMRGGGLA